MWSWRISSPGMGTAQGLQTCSGGLEGPALGPAEGSGDRTPAEGWERQARAGGSRKLGKHQGRTAQLSLPALLTPPAHPTFHRFPLSLLPTSASSLGFNPFLEEEGSAGPEQNMEMAQAEQRRA